MARSVCRIRTLAGVALLPAALLAGLPATAAPQGRETTSRPSDSSRLTAEQRRERDAYWAGVMDGYRARNRPPLPGQPYGPIYGYPSHRNTPQAGGGVDHTYAPWATRGP